MNIDLSKLQKLEVGKPYPGDIPINQGIAIDMDNSGFLVYAILKNPTDKEINNYREGSVQFAMTVREGVIFILMKFGDLPWVDVPYNVNLSLNLTNLPIPRETQGYAVQIILVNSVTKIVHALRLIGLQHKFSLALRDSMIKQQFDEITIEEYNEHVDHVYAMHTTADLLSLATARCKIGD